jgi:hypothetical protein
VVWEIMTLGGDGEILLDDALWPLLIVRFVGVPTTSQVASYLERMTAYMERGERNVTLIDSTRVSGMVPAEQRNLQAAWMKKHAARMRELNLGTAFVITSPLVRLAVSVIFHLQPMASPYIITGTLGEAAEWAAVQLEKDQQLLAAQRIREHFG